MAVFLLILIFGGSLLVPLFTATTVNVNLAQYNLAPSLTHLLGTDTLGRDIFTMIWLGGRISLFIGCLATIIATTIAIIYGATIATTPHWIAAILQRFLDILISLPNLLLVIILQAIAGTVSPLSLAIVIGCSSWFTIAKVVATEISQLLQADYILNVRAMGASFGYILYHHLTPQLIPAIIFMIVINIRSAIVTEATLSFMGLGLPLATISWGSMLSLAEKAFLTDAWWIIVVPGSFLVITILCLTNLGHRVYKKFTHTM